MHNIGKYTILEQLGRGAFATVFRARDTVLQRDVALKVLHPPLLADPDFVQRFEADARAAAQLEHPHIVTIHDLGQAETRYYIAMQYLSGGTLADRLKSGPLPWGDAVRVVAEIAEALDFVHARGFIHRDVKPTNILFNARGEAVLADFGLVKAVESSSVARSSTGGVIGTPAYLAPEVWEGKPASPATDVYALGCVLFEMLTGTALFKGDTTPAVMRAHFLPHEYPETWPEGVPPEVENLLRRALAQNPTERYSAAGDFAEALHHLLERGSAETARRAAEAQAQAERAQWAAQWRAEAEAAQQAGQWDAARIAAQKWLEMAPEDAAAKALLANATCRTDLTGFSKPVRSIPIWAWGVGALLLVIVMIGVVGGGWVLLRWALASASPVATVTVTNTAHPMATTTVPATPTHTPTASSHPTHLPSATSRPSHTPTLTTPPTVRPTATQMLVPTPTIIEDISSWILVRTFAAHSDATRDVAFSPDGKILASAGDNLVKLWQTSDTALLQTLSGQRGYVVSIAFSPDGQLLASGSWGGTVYLWRVSDGKHIATFSGHTKGVQSIAFSPNGKLLVSGADDNTVRIWSVPDGTLLKTLEGHTDSIFSVATSPDGAIVASGSGDKTIRIWRISDGSLLHTLRAHRGPIYSVHFSPDGTMLASGEWGTTVCLWKTEEGSLINQFTTMSYVKRVTFSPSGKVLAVGEFSGSEGVIELRQIPDGKVLRTFTELSCVMSVTFDPDEQNLAAGQCNGVSIWGAP